MKTAIKNNAALIVLGLSILGMYAMAVAIGLAVRVPMSPLDYANVYGTLAVLVPLLIGFAGGLAVWVFRKR